MSQTEYLGATAVFGIPDWFGDGQDFCWWDNTYHRNISGNHAWDRLYQTASALGVDFDETCSDPMGKWLSVKLDPRLSVDAQIRDIRDILDYLIEEEKRHAANPANAESGRIRTAPGTEGQDRKSYTDDQDRDSYSV